MKIIATPLFQSTSKANLEERLDKRYMEIKHGQSENPTTEAMIKVFKPYVKKEEFIERVEKIKKHIDNGEVLQVVLSQRLQATFTGDPFAFYRKLRVENPSPYLYYIDFADYQIVGSSPESLIKVNVEKVTINPIAGTRPRGQSEAEDKQIEVDLIHDEKEISEHMMLLELGLEDLSRICKPNTLQVDREMKIERYKHVMHLVSEVSGKLKSELTAVDALIACLPAGTVSGTPKVRAMEIINELEDVKRSIYSGAIGYFSVNGNMDMAIAIRTMLIKEEVAYIQAGAGIVHDSNPEKEYEETLHKLRAFLIKQQEIAH